MWELRMTKSKTWAGQPLTKRQDDFSKYDDFMKRHPLASRMMMDGKYDAVAFVKYLKRLNTIGSKTNLEWSERQADYAKFLTLANGGTYAEGKTAYERWKKELLPPPKPKSEPAPDEIGAKDVAREMVTFYRGKATDPEWMKKNFNDKQIDFRVAGYADFMQKYPIVARHLIEFGEFSMPAFERYLEKLRVVGYNSLDEWAQRQADYVKYLCRAYDPKAPRNMINYYYENARKGLINETASFKKDYEAAKDKVSSVQTTVNKEIRTDLKKMIEADPEMLQRLAEMKRKIDESRSPPTTEQKADPQPPQYQPMSVQDPPRDIATRIEKHRARNKVRRLKKQALLPSLPVETPVATPVAKKRPISQLSKLAQASPK